MARVLEHYAKQLLQERGFPVPERFIVDGPEDSLHVLPPIAPPWIVKALVPMGRKGKAGLIRSAETPAGMRSAVADLLGRNAEGFPVERVLVEKKVSIAKEFYVSFTYDNLERSPVLLFSPRGGMEIEALSRERPELLFFHPIDIISGFHPFQARALCFKAGLSPEETALVAPILIDLWHFFYDLDLRLLEINPLCLLMDGSLCIVGVLINADEDALFRHPELAGIAAYGLDRSLSGLTARERRVVEADLAAPGSGAVRYTELDGDIAFCIIGGGASLVAMDAIVRKGGRPANYSDIGPGKDSRAKMAALLEATLTKPGLRGLIVGCSVLAATDLSGMSRGLLQALDRYGIDPHRIPVVVRLAGLGEEGSRVDLADISGIRFFGSEITIEEAAEKIVASVETLESREETP